ncbi:MAG: DUF3379 domain-containing protein [Bacteroidales bacterium]|nr:DUF3379 domain-containing protein [Bacteroidales bacterium]MCF8390827.1 DUF3379 domain-containing protein [Bacteroidales bacterium]
MNCNQIYKNINLDFSNEEFRNHLEECPRCNELYSKVNDTMAILDEIVEVPDGMTERILKRKKQTEQIKLRKWNISGYLQLAAAILFGVFIGHVFGRNASLDSILQKKQDPLTEYYNIHHLKVDYSEFDIRSL